MLEKKGLLAALRPEIYGIAQGVHGDEVTPNIRTAKVDILHVVHLSLEVSNLANIVRDGIKKALANVGVFEFPVSPCYICV